LSIKPQNRALAGFLAALLCTACSSKSFSVGSVPFPAQNPVFVDALGAPQSGLPESLEPFRLILLDYVWCPPCAETRKAIRGASRAIPEGSVRVYRILFDRETLYSPGETREVPPLSSSPPPGFEGRGGAGSSRVTTLTALPAAFRKEYRVTQGPVLLLLDANGAVSRKWTGYSTSLTEELVAEIRKRSPAPSPLPPGK
jgi:hypothetical protein